MWHFIVCHILAQVSIHLFYGALLYSWKKNNQKKTTLAFCDTHVVALRSRGRAKKKQRECFFFSSYPSRSVLFSCFSIVHFQFAFLDGNANPTSSLWAMDVAELQRQISRLSLEDLIQVAIHLIFEIEYRLELQRTRDQDISDSDISDSDDDLWFEFFLSLDDEPWQRWWLAAHWWRVGTLGFGFNHCRYIRNFLPPVSKSSQLHQSKSGTSSNLLPSAPLPIPAPPPKQGRYPIIAGRPLPVPAFRPPMVQRDVQVNKPPAVNKPFLMQTSAMQTSVQHTSGAFPISRPAKVSSTTAVTARTKFPSQCPHLVQLFIECVSSLGQHCKLHEVLTASHHSKIHIHSVLDQFAASTVWRYLSIWQHFHRAVLDMDLSIDMSDSELADVIVALSLAHHSDKSTGSGSISTIKALRWMIKTAGITALESVAYGTVISSFLKSKIPRERKEAFPLSLFVVLQWERRILQSNCPTRDVILLGGFLACIFAGLRFSDLQRVSWKSIVFDYTRQFVEHVGGQRHLLQANHLGFIVTDSSAEESIAGLSNGFSHWTLQDICINPLTSQCLALISFCLPWMHWVWYNLCSQWHMPELWSFYDGVLHYLGSQALSLCRPWISRFIPSRRRCYRGVLK